MLLQEEYRLQSEASVYICIVLLVDAPRLLEDISRERIVEAASLAARAGEVGVEAKHSQSMGRAISVVPWIGDGTYSSRLYPGVFYEVTV